MRTDTSSAWDTFSTTGLGNIQSGGGIAADGSYLYAVQGSQGTEFTGIPPRTLPALGGFALPVAEMLAEISLLPIRIFIFFRKQHALYKHTLSATSGAWTSYLFAYYNSNGGGISIQNGYIYVLEGRSGG